MKKLALLSLLAVAGGSRVGTGHGKTRRADRRLHSGRGLARDGAPVAGDPRHRRQAHRHEGRHVRRLGLQRHDRGAARRPRRRRAARAVLVRARDHGGAGRGLRGHGDRAHHAAELPVDHHRGQGQADQFARRPQGQDLRVRRPGLDLRLHGALGGVHQGRHHAGEGFQPGDVLGRPRRHHRRGGLGQGRGRRGRRPHLRARLRQGAGRLQQAEGGLDVARRSPTTRCSTARTCPRT